MAVIEIKETFGKYRSGFVENNSINSKMPAEKIRIHFIEKNFQKKDTMAVVMSPGLWEPAERAIPLFDALDYHCVSLSFRGRGQSSTPVTGYDLNDHVSDLSAVIDGLKLVSIVITAFSKGVQYACGYAAKYPKKIKGMILIDQAPVHIKPPPGYASYWKNLVYLGKSSIKYMRPEALDGIEKESTEISFWSKIL